METAHRRHHCGGTGAEHLEQPPLLEGSHDLAHGDLPLGDGEVRPGGAHLYDGPPGDAWQDGPHAEGRRHQLPHPVLSPEEDEEVHGTHLGDLVVLAEQPEALLTAVLLCDLKQFSQLSVHAGDGHLLGPEGGGVVGSHLGEAAAARPGPHVARVTEQVDRLEPGGVVRPHRAE